jgi:signal transduction histidine kinase
MSTSFALNWALMAISLINTILMLWLGLTVLLNAERRTWGAWIAGTGLMLGGLFFFSHSAILGYGLEIPGFGLNFWWQIAWIPVVALPFVWYVMMLWYAGYWEKNNTQLQKRQRNWFYIAFILVLCTFSVAIYANPIPSFTQYADAGLKATPTIGGVPIIVITYSVYILFCISLSLDALRRPGPSARVMGELARQRARPWLIGTSITLLLVSFIVAWAMFWIVVHAQTSRAFYEQTNTIAWFDLAIATLIGIAVILLGQAIVAYEIFTGKALPRRGFLRHWRRAIILAFGYGILVSFSFNTNLRPIYILLLTSLLMTFFYALLSWRSYTERERYIEHLRPFVASQGLFDQLLTRSTTTPSEVDLQTPFDALCKEVIDAKVAYLLAIGPLAPLVGSALTYPGYKDFEPRGLQELLAEFKTPEPKAIRIDSSKYHEAAWAVPLWSERGLSGVLLLGEKRDGGLYTQEEIEIAQTSGERLIDTKASAEIAQRLMSLQRQRLAESQLLDQRARRVLHDDVLQQLHTAMLKLVAEKSRPNGGTSEAIELLADVHSQISELLRDMPTTTLPEIAKLGLIGALRKLVDEELGMAFESVKWKIEYEAERFAQDISPLTAEVLFYATREAIRNAARHGRHEGIEHPLHLLIRFLWQDGLMIQVEDDGVGVRSERTIGAGSGQGLALHSTMMAVVGGELAVESEPGEYTKVSLIIPQGS